MSLFFHIYALLSQAVRLCACYICICYMCFYSYVHAASNQSPSSSTSPTQSLTASTSLHAPIVGGIAIKVNNDPITLYEISHLSKSAHISTTRAKDILIAQRLKEQEIKRLNIITDDARLDQEINAIAAQNRLTFEQFLQALRQQGMSLESYKKQLAEQIQTRELMRNILASSNTTSEEALRKYYNQHSEEFLATSSIRVTRYNSQDPKLLEQTISKRSLSIRGVEKVEETLSLSTLNPQIAQMFSQLRVGEFSPILDAGGGMYVVFLIQEKKGEGRMSFEEAKNIIAQRLAQEQQEHILSEYFEKIKQQARIEYVR